MGERNTEPSGQNATALHVTQNCLWKVLPYWCFTVTQSLKNLH